jgi:hypothetical protein
MHGDALPAFSRLLVSHDSLIGGQNSRNSNVAIVRKVFQTSFC